MHPNVLPECALDIMAGVTYLLRGSHARTTSDVGLSA